MLTTIAIWYICGMLVSMAAMHYIMYRDDSRYTVWTMLGYTFMFIFFWYVFSIAWLILCAQELEMYSVKN